MFKVNAIYSLDILNILFQYDCLFGWLGFTATKHFIGYIAPVSVVNVRMSARAGLVGVVPPCTLEQWVNSPPPSHWGY